MPVDAVRTAFSGTAGILKESADEVAYIVSPDGSRIAQVNPGEQLSIAFAHVEEAQDVQHHVQLFLALHLHVHLAAGN